MKEIPSKSWCTGQLIIFMLHCAPSAKPMELKQIVHVLGNAHITAIEPKEGTGKRSEVSYTLSTKEMNNISAKTTVPSSLTELLPY